MKALSLVALLAAMCAASAAGLPEQFRIWGKTGPEFPPVPEGWTELRDASDGAPSITPTPDEQRRGYVLFARDPFVTISPYSLPFASERVTELKAFAARGEYEPISFAIHALDALSDVKVEVSDLTSPDGIIPSSNIDARVVRCVRQPVDNNAKTYRLVPFLLEKRDAFSVARGATAQVWLTLKVPDAAKAGGYAGTITIRAAGRDSASLKLSVQVLPFALPRAPIELIMFFPRPSPSDEMLQKELIDLREHGCTSIIPAAEVQIKTRDRNLGEDDIAATKAYSKRLMDAIRQTWGEWRFPVTFEAGHQISFFWDVQKAWFVFWPHDGKVEGDLFRAVDVIRDLAKAEGWPPLQVYTVDEAGAHYLLDEAVYYYKLLKGRYPDIPTYTTIGGGMAMGLDEIGQLSPVIDFLSTNRFTPEIARALVDRGKPYGAYNGAGPTVAGSRFFFGFYGWKTGAQQVDQWVYSFGESVFKGNGFRQEDEGYVYHADDGPLPSIAWEAAREGTDDYRHVHLLWQMIAVAKASGNADAPKAATEASQVLNGLLGEIGWKFQALDGSQRTPPPHPSTLRKWRWRVAQQILALQKHVGADVKAPAPKHSPFDFPWAQPEVEQVKYGDEILPASDFETTMKPWRIEAWNGKGTGALDDAEHHGGLGSVRIDNPPDSKNEAVTVLVWPTWGGGGLNLSLAGDRTCELSAWAKCKGRNMAPELRLNVPADATRSVRTGKDAPTPDGWQRVWLRTEMAFKAAPSYIGVWVQGPGSVWVDDLSLREVILPPLHVSLDQAEYDGADKVAVAAVTVAKRATPASVRFSLSPAGGKAIAELTAPFQAQVAIGPAAGADKASLMLIAPASLGSSRVVFDPSTLAPGSYDAKVELLDAAGVTTAERGVRFRRE